MVATATLFGAWYTFDAAAGDVDAQRWYSLQGNLRDSRPGANLTIYRNVGGRFASPPSTTATPVGTASFVFDSCTSGFFAYTFDDGRQGEIRLRPLVSTSGCVETEPPSENVPGPDDLSGAWYEPAFSGQGIAVSIDASGTVLVGWYSYTDEGSAGPEGQRWFSAQGTFGDNDSAELVIYTSTGGAFAIDGSATTVPIGTATLDFESCTSATLAYSIDEGELAGKSGMLDLVRLTAAPDGCSIAR